MQAIDMGVYTSGEQDDEYEIRPVTADAVASFLGECAWECADDVLVGEVDGVRSFAEAGLATWHAGFVLKLANGQEFSVTVRGR